MHNVIVVHGGPHKIVAAILGMSLGFVRQVAAVFVLLFQQKKYQRVRPPISSLCPSLKPEVVRDALNGIIYNT